MEERKKIEKRRGDKVGGCFVDVASFMNVGLSRVVRCVQGLTEQKGGVEKRGGGCEGS
jgi:hypothetical protein